MKSIKNSVGKTAIIYPFLPHYRYGVFKELDENIQDLIFLADRASGNRSVAITPPESFSMEEEVHNKWWGRILWQRGLGRKLLKHNPQTLIFLGDVAHISTWVYAIIARLLGRRVFFWTIGWHRPESGIKRLVRLAFYHISNGLLLYWDNGRKLGKKYGFPDRKMFVIYNSYASKTNETSAQLNLNIEPEMASPMIGAVARLSPNKELTTIVRAAALLSRKHGLDVGCLIVGEGPERENLELLAKELGVNLQLPGAVYHPEELKEVYRHLTITIVPKNAGLTVLQSLSAGTPVITISNPYQQGPEFESIQDGVNGSLVEVADAESIAEAAVYWLRDSALRPAEQAKVCRESIGENWSPDSQATLLLKVLREEY